MIALCVLGHANTVGILRTLLLHAESQLKGQSVCRVNSESIYRDGYPDFFDSDPPCKMHNMHTCMHVFTNNEKANNSLLAMCDASSLEL